MLDSLRDIVQEVSAAANLAEVLNIAVRRVKEVMQVGNCSIYLHDPKSHMLVLRASDGYLPEAIGKVRIPDTQGLVGLVATREEPINLEKASEHPSFAYYPETGEERFSSYLGVPIIHNRRMLGVMLVQQEEQRRFDEGEEAFLVTISAQLAGAIAHAEATGALHEPVSTKEREAKKKPSETILSGIPSAPGIAIGTAVLVASPADLYAVPRRYTNNTKDELKLFKTAIRRTKQDLHSLDGSLLNKLSSGERALFGVYISMLDDHSLSDEVTGLIRNGLTAQSAWSEIIREHVRRFKGMRDPYLRERGADVLDLGKRVLAHLQQSQEISIEYPDNTILIGEDLAAPMLADVPHDKLKGMVSVRGSHNSHMAILGRALGIPTVMGAVDLPLTVLDGCELIIDGNRGRVVANPSSAARKAYRQQQEEEALLAADLETLRDQPCLTADQHRIALWVNTGLRIDTMLSLDRGAEGVGLYRTEVPFLMHERFPSEEEQRQLYREQLEMFAPRPVTMRTLDIGGDKSLPYFPIEEANPFLGWRGIRVTLDHPEIFLSQIRAMMKASEGLNNLRIMLPMISNVPELESALVLIRRAFEELTKEEGRNLVMPAIGAMVEVPAAVYQVRDIARRVDFLSVGTNDLTQYLLAVDRNNPRVAGLYHAFHPALLGALRLVVEGARAENCQVSVCGEMAGDPLGAVLLVGMGYEVLSMSSANLLRVKSILRQISCEEARKLAEGSLTLSDTFAVREYLQHHLARPGLEQLLRTTTVD